MLIAQGSWFRVPRSFVTATLLLCVSTPLYASLGGYEVIDTFGDVSNPLRWQEAALDWRNETGAGTWEKVTSPVTSGKALHLVNNRSTDARTIGAELQGESLSAPIAISVRYARTADGDNDGNQSFSVNLADSRGGSYSLRVRTYNSGFKYVLTKAEGTGTPLSFNFAGIRDLANHVYRLTWTIDRGRSSLVIVDEATNTSSTSFDLSDARLSLFENFERVKLVQHKEHANFYFEDLAVKRAPFKNLQAPIAEVDLGNALTSEVYESSTTGVQVKRILGQDVRSGSVSTKGWFGFRIGDNTKVATNKPYLLELVVPEDVPRSWLIMVMDTRNTQQSGNHLAFHTGIYNVEGKRGFYDYNRLTQKLRQRFVSYWAVVWPSQNDSFKSGQRLWVYCYNKDDDANNQGVAIKAARLYAVNDVADLIDPEVDALRTRSPRRLMWSTEAQQYPSDVDVMKTRIAGANTLAFNVMPWNFGGGNTPRYYKGYQQYLSNLMTKAMPVAQQHGVNLVARLEYAHSPWVYTLETFEDAAGEVDPALKKLSYPDDALQFKTLTTGTTWKALTSTVTGKEAIQMVDNGETDVSYVRTPMALGKRINGPVTVRVDYSRTRTTTDASVALFIRLLDDLGNGYVATARAGASTWQYSIARVDAGAAASTLVKQVGSGPTNAGVTELADHLYSLSMTVGAGQDSLVLEDLTANTKQVLFSETNNGKMTYGTNFATLDIGQRRGYNGYFIEEVAVGRKGAVGISTQGKPWHREDMQMGGHLGHFYTRANIIIDPNHLDERGGVIVDDLMGIIDEMYGYAGSYANQLTGVYLRNRVGRLAPSFAAADIAQFERETQTTVPGSTYDAKRATLHSQLAFEYDGSFSVGDAWQHPYLQWWYKKLGIFLQTVQDRIRAKWGSDKELYFHFRSGEGFMDAKPDTTPTQWLNNAEWGIDSAFGDQLTDVRFLNVVTQPWAASNTQYLRGKVTSGPMAIDVEPGYIEYAWDVVKGIKPAPSFEPGTGTYSSRIELLATAYGDPMTLSREVFTSIQRGFPGEWADFARQFYSLPKSGGTTANLNIPGLVAMTYPSGEIALFNVGETEQTFNVSTNWATLKEVRNNRALDPRSVKLRAFSMIVVKP